MEKYSTPENENNFKGLSHYFHGKVTIQVSLDPPLILAQVLRGIESGMDYMLFRPWKNTV